MSNVEAAGDVAQCLAQVAALDRLALLMRGELGLADETLPVRVGARGPRLCGRGLARAQIPQVRPE